MTIPIRIWDSLIISSIGPTSIQSAVRNYGIVASLSYPPVMGLHMRIVLENSEAQVCTGIDPGPYINHIEQTSS